LHQRFVGCDFSLNEIAVLKSEAFLLFDLPFPDLNDLLQNIEHDEIQSDVGNVDVSNIRLDVTAEHISNGLKVLNKAAFEFWSSADPDRQNYPPNK